MTRLDYQYAGARAKTLERKLLSETQLELITSAKSVEELHRVLYDTYLAPYLTKTQTVGDITRAIDESIRDAKKTLLTIAPDPKLLDILWLKYDLHNSKVLVKGTRANLSDDELLALMSHAGTVEPSRLLTAFKDDAMTVLHPDLILGIQEAKRATHPLTIDATLNRAYVRAIKSHVNTDIFVQRFVERLIDVFNIKAALRTGKHPDLDVRDVFTDGGSFSLAMLDSEEHIGMRIRTWGHEGELRAALEESREAGSYAPLERIIDEQFNDFLRRESLPVFTLASLFAYFSAQKNNAQIIGAVAVAKESGMHEKELRRVLRRLYT